MAATDNYLDNDLPIRRILADGVATPFIRDLDFSSDYFELEVDEQAHVLRVTAPGLKPDNPSPAAEIQGLIDGGATRIRVQPGTYSLDSPIVMRDDVELVCDGRAVFKPTYVGVGADDIDNGVVCFIGEAGFEGALTLTLSALIKPGATSITVTASLDASLAGASFYVYAQNTSGSSAFVGSEGSYAKVGELFTIAASFAGGTTLPLTRKAKFYHQTGLSLAQVRPVRRAKVSGVYVDSGANATIACGFAFNYAENCTIERCGGKGLSRAVASLHIAHGVIAQNTLDDGGSNCSFLYESAHDSYDLFTLRPDHGDRYHVNGIPRPCITFRAMCTDCHSHYGSFANCSGLLRHSGGLRNTMTHFQAKNLDATELRIRENLSGFIPSDGAYGYLWDVGSGVLVDEGKETGFGCGMHYGTVIAPKQITRSTLAGVRGECAFFIQDHDDPVISHVRVDATDQATNHWAGFRISDSRRCRFVDVQLIACDFPWVTENTVATGVCESCTFTPEEDSVTPYAIVWGHQFGDSRNGGFQFQDLSIGNFLGTWCAAVSGWTIDHEIKFHSVIFQGLTYEDCTMQEVSGSVTTYGYFAKLAGGVASEATAPTRDCGVFASTNTNGVALVSRGTATIFYTGGAPAPDDIILPDSVGRGVVSASPSILAARYYKARRAGSSNYVVADPHEQLHGAASSSADYIYTCPAGQAHFWKEDTIVLATLQDIGGVTTWQDQQGVLDLISGANRVRGASYVAAQCPIFAHQLFDGSANFIWSDANGVTIGNAVSEADQGGALKLKLGTPSGNPDASCVYLYQDNAAKTVKLRWPDGTIQTVTAV